MRLFGLPFSTHITLLATPLLLMVGTSALSDESKLCQVGDPTGFKNVGTTKWKVGKFERGETWLTANITDRLRVEGRCLGDLRPGQPGTNLQAAKCLLTLGGPAGGLVGLCLNTGEVEEHEKIRGNGRACVTTKDKGKGRPQCIHDTFLDLTKGDVELFFKRTSPEPSPKKPGPAT